MRALEMWGGHECTVNRVGDTWRDQTRLTGHHERIDDLDRFASLGLKALRYPVLWERTETAPGRYDWSWADARLERIRALGMEPIVGLVHHGSGPAYTSLIDEAFAPKLAAYAGAVAERYPWVRNWTPVNEPLTTARFSALYGHWYPHRRDERSFWVALLNQVDATRLSMRAIRGVNPQARLIQTEDFGRTYATDRCGGQAAHDNARRFMTWDLLTGRVAPGHPMYDRVVRLGLRDRLAAIADDPCPPDVIGLNHYATSDRFLDHRLERYPAHVHGGNGRVAYADVEAVRVLDPAPPGWSEHLRVLWARYRLPIAITECHLGCTREEQLRWLSECWDAATAARADGVEVEAVTAWNLLGGYDWDSLLTRPADRYETGVYDLRQGYPAPTALARLVRDLATNGSTDLPLAHEPGWWRRPERLLYPVHAESDPGHVPPPRVRSSQPIRLAAGAGPELVRACELRGLFVVTGDQPSPSSGAPWLTISDPGQEADGHTQLDRWLDRLLAAEFEGEHRP
jgi:dTDP-4-dehydrorhamnose reductase